MALIEGKRGYEVQGFYGRGWERLTVEKDYLFAEIRLRCFEDTAPTIPYRIKEVSAERKEVKDD